MDRGLEGVKFGIFYEHQLPRDWDEFSEHKLIKASLDQIEHDFFQPTALH